MLGAGLVLAAVSAAGLALPSGLRAQFFLGSAFAGPPVRNALDTTFSTNQLSQSWDFKPPDAFSAQWSGYLFANRAGLYTFTIVADDGSRMYVDQRPVIEEQGQGPGIRTGQIRLERGPHAILLQYVQLGGPYHLEWIWARDGGSPAPVPAWALSPRARGGATVLARLALDVVWWLALAVALALGVRFVYSPSYWAARRAALPADGDPSPPWPENRGRTVAALALFVVLAAAETWPLVTSPGHLSRNDNADTMLNEWAIAWIAHQLPRDPLHVFDAPIFHPNRHTLAYSEPLITHGALGAPLFWLGASPVLIYNLLLLAGLSLTGWMMSLVVARWTGDWPAGIVAGILVAFNAHTLTRLPHLQAQHAELLPLALLVLDALLLRPRWALATCLAAVFLLQALTSIYLLVFTAVAATVAVLARPEDWLGARARMIAPKLALAVVLMAVAIVPLLWPYWQLRSVGFERSLDEVAWFSARAGDYWTTPARLHGWLGTSARSANSLFPGFTAIALVAVALLQRGALGDRRVRMSLAIGGVGVILSFGPLVPGYPLLYAAFPPLQAVRAAVRFGYLGLVATAIVAGYGMAALGRRLSPRPVARHAAGAAVILLVLAESFAAPITYQPFTEVPAIYGSRDLESAGAVANLPLPPPEAIYRNAPFMLGSTRHFRPMLNGYSGFIPPSYYAQYQQLAGFPDEASLGALQTLGVTHVFVHRDWLSLETADRVTRVAGLRLVDAEGPIALYRVGP